MQNIHANLYHFFADAPSFPRRGRLVVACSAGPDSVALAYALNDLAQKGDHFPYEFHLAHVNHKLRGQASAADARFVKRLAAQLGWPYHQRIAPIRSSSGNLEEMARVERYNALCAIAKKIESRAVLTAHTLDDQVETILMNLLRGSGATGLGGMSPLRSWMKTGILIGRPLLGISKQDIQAIVNSRKLAYRRDASNDNPRFLRNWLRKTIVPQLRRRVPGFEQRLAKMAALLRDEEVVWNTLLEHMSQRFLRKHKRGHLLDFEGVLSYSAAAERRFLRRIMGGDTLDFEGVERLRQWMAAPPSGGRIWQGRLGWVAERLSKSKGAPSTKLFWIRKINSK